MTFPVAFPVRSGLYFRRKGLRWRICVLIGTIWKWNASGTRLMDITSLFFFFYQREELLNLVFLLILRP